MVPQLHHRELALDRCCSEVFLVFLLGPSPTAEAREGIPVSDWHGIWMLGDLGICQELASIPPQSVEAHSGTGTMVEIDVVFCHWP